MTAFEDNVTDVQEFIDSDRFSGITRLYSARQVAEQHGTIGTDYRVARENAAAFYARLRELFAERKSITTFGPYSPSQAVTMKRMGIEGIYLGGWATSAKGSDHRGPGRRPGELPALTGARRGRVDRPRAADSRPQPDLPALAHDPRAARGRARAGRLPAVHHRRRRHRPRRRRARAQPDPPVRRGRRHRLPHRGPAARHEEVRPPGRQGARRRRRADQASQRRPLPARHHGRARHHRRAHRRRGGEPPRQSGDERDHPFILGATTPQRARRTSSRRWR